MYNTLSTTISHSTFQFPANINLSSKISYEQFLLNYNKSLSSDYDSAYHNFDYENMYSPLSPSYIPEIYPSNLSIVTPSPDSYFRFLSTQQSLLQTSQEPKKNDSDNVTVHEVSNGLNGMLYPTVPTRGVGYGYDDTIKDCPFIDDENHVRGLKAGAYWLYTGSILLLLACNIIFLIWIMKVCIK